MLKAQDAGHSAGRVGYLQCSVRLSQACLVEVGHAHSISQPNLLTMCQAPHKCSVGKAIEEGCREVNLVQSQLGNSQAFQTGLQETTSLEKLSQVHQ